MRVGQDSSYALHILRLKIAKTYVNFSAHKSPQKRDETEILEGSSLKPLSVLQKSADKTDKSDGSDHFATPKLD